MGFVGVFFLIDFFERIDNFLERDLPLDVPVKYFLLKIPFMMEQVMPITIMLSGVITLGLLNYKKELLSFQSAGIRVSRIIRPLVLGAILVSVFSLGMEQWLLPPTINKADKIWSEKVKNEIIEGIVREGKVYYRGKEGIYTFVRSETSGLSDFSYAAWDETYGFLLQILAREAEWHPGGWICFDGLIKKKSADGKIEVNLFERLQLQLPETSEDLFVPRPDPSMLSLAELLEKSSGDDSHARRQARNILHYKLSYILLGIPLLLVGLPLLLFLNSAWRLDLSLSVPICCALAYLVWLLWGGLQSYARAGYIDPVLASWPVHIVAVMMGLSFIRIRDR